MAERSTAVIVGGIIALIGAVLGLYGWYVLTGMANAYSMSSLYFFISPTAGLVAWFTTPAVDFYLPLLVLSGSILAIVFSVVLISGRIMRVAAILIIIAGILSIHPIFYGIYLWGIPGVLEIVGPIVALARGAW
jgi:hypothetical protein